MKSVHVLSGILIVMFSIFVWRRFFQKEMMIDPITGMYTGMGPQVSTM